jgi:hypothetical protein
MFLTSLNYHRSQFNFQIIEIFTSCTQAIKAPLAVWNADVSDTCATRAAFVSVQIFSLSLYTSSIETSFFAYPQT